jgi:hypothetical protein
MLNWISWDPRHVSYEPSGPQSAALLDGERLAKASNVLVLYVYSNTDPEYVNNLKFFLREGVHAEDGCDYLFIVNGGSEEVRAYAPAPAHAPGCATSW